MSIVNDLENGKKFIVESENAKAQDEILVYKNDEIRRTKKRAVMGTGWGYYFDSNHTDSTPFNVNNETKQLTIDGLGVFSDTRFLPSRAQSLWSNNEMTPIATGDFYSLRLDFTAVPSGNADSFNIMFDIGGASEDIIISHRFEINKSIGTPEMFAFDTMIYTSEGFKENNGKIKIQSDDDIDFYNVGVLISRVHCEE